jgi:hypothetical protein
MGTFLAVLLIFAVLIGVGIKVSTSLYSSTHVGRRFRLRRRGQTVELVPAEDVEGIAGIPVTVEEPLIEEPVIDAPIDMLE